MKQIFLILLAAVSLTPASAQFASNALDFDGTNDMVVISTVPSYFSALGSNDFTIEAWVNPRGSAFQRVFFAQPSTTNFVSFGPSTGNVFYLYVIVNGTTYSVATSASIPQNQWTHVAGRWTAATLTPQILFNGVVQSTSAGGSSSTGTNGLMTLGTRPGGFQYFNGAMDEVRLWNEARTDCEIVGNMNHHITGAETNLTFNFDFNQGVAAGNNAGINTLPDNSGNSYTGTLTNFALTGTSSNWITSGATVSSSASSQNVPGPAITSQPSAVTLCSNGNASYTVSSSASSFQWQENNGTGWISLSNTSVYSGATTNSLVITGASNVMTGYRYRCVVTANACSNTSDSAMLYVSNISTSAASQTDVTCFGNTNGGAAINTPTGGNGVYTYDWAPGNPTGDGTIAVSNLTAGGYTCTITDAVGCSATQTYTITEPTALVATSSGTSILCNGGNSTVTLGASGGIAPYGGTGTTTEAAGTFTYTITDANGCISTTTIIITEPAALTAQLITAADVTTCGGNDGAIDISVGGGIPAYSFLWNNAAVTEDLSGLIAGTYNVGVTDANGCTTSVSATINDPAPPVVTFNSPIDTVCQTTQSPFTLAGESPAGGTFAGPGVSGNSFDPMSAGNGINLITYTYTDANGCSAIAVDSIYVDFCLGIAQNAASDFSIVPNPNGGAFSVLINANESAQVIIYNALGQIVLSDHVPAQIATQFVIDRPGVYMLVVISADGKRSAQQVIVE
jgi:hypothetical protein